MKVKIELNVRPWLVPNFVNTEEENGKEITSIATKDVDPDLLSSLCDQFRADVFARAGKQDPRLKD